MVYDKNIICFEEERLRRALKQKEKDLRMLRTLISHGDYDLVSEAMELEANIIEIENALIMLIEAGLDEAPTEEG